jgi:lysine 2,3-aminomutase
MKFYHSYCDIISFLGCAENIDLEKVDAVYPCLANEYYLKLIDTGNLADDPIAKQIIPDSRELNDCDSSYDPLSETEQSPVPGLVHRFVDRAVLLATGRCAVRCRFCFRKRTWTNGGETLPDIDDSRLIKICEYLRGKQEIREVLISGGDPLMLPFERLKKIILELSKLDNIEIIRVGSRIPVVWPQRITTEISDFLGSVPGLWFATHFNHPREVTAESIEACSLLVKAGVPVINQTVLLKGINDDPTILEDLFRRLIKIRVKPHYLFHVDPVRGVRHFATGIECGLDILRKFRPRLSSLAVPAFAIDLPEGGGKVALQAQYRTADEFRDIFDCKNIIYPDA